MAVVNLRYAQIAPEMGLIRLKDVDFSQYVFILFSAALKPESTYPPPNAQPTPCPLRTPSATEAGAYVPAYVRRYPFIFVEQPDGQRLTLCIDEAAEQLSTDGPRPLFDGNQPAEVTRQALELCTGFQRDAAATSAFVEALESKELLVERRADIALEHGGHLALAGFRVVDEAKFNAPDDATFLDWRLRGWIALVYCHLLSSGNWGGLVERAARRAQ